MATIPGMTIKVKVTGIGGGPVRRRILGFIARLLGIKLDITV